jgi:hypothetical protein
MTLNPYKELPSSAFWRAGVTEENPYFMRKLYQKKYEILPTTRIATAGSCFAQHITRHLKKKGFSVLDVEPPPPGLPPSLHNEFGFSMYSARYGNIYTVRQLLQLAEEAAGEWVPQAFIWEKNGRFFDALRPATEPEGLACREEVILHRKYHIQKVKELFLNLDLLIFTLGLTEMWEHKASGTVYPTAPGVIAGQYDASLYRFTNAQFKSVLKDFKKFEKTMKKIRAGRPFKVILTVSPVPLTATASGQHVLAATNYSKSILRSVAGQLSSKYAHIDYFPSYEIVTNPRLHSTSFSENLRSVRNEAVENAMKHFFTQHVAPNAKNFVSETNQNSLGSDADAVKCQEELLSLFEK